MIYVGSLAGLLPGGPGHSHQSVRDISALCAVPGLLLVEPCVEREVGLLLDYCVNRTDDSAYLRLVSLGWPVPFTLPAAYRVEEGRGAVVRKGRDAVMIGYGPWLLANAWAAAEELAGRCDLKVVNLPWLNRVDREWLRGVIDGASHVLTLDNHYVHGGQGQMIAAAIAGLGLARPPRVTSIGVTELPKCGTNEEVLQYHRLDVDGLVHQVLEALQVTVA